MFEPEILQGEIVMAVGRVRHEVAVVERPVDAQAYDEDSEIIVIVLDNGMRVFVG